MEEENELITVNVQDNINSSITNITYWEIFIFVDEKWELLETREGNLTDVLAYMYDLDKENLGIKINNQINQFS
jgi:hypothetical protein